MDQLLMGRARSMDAFGTLAQRVFVPAEIAAALADWRPRPTDVVISPYGKCGTTYLQQIFHTLRTGGDMAFDDISAVVPWLETATLLGIDLNAEQKANPRGFKSHLPFDAIPPGARAICCFREPKDAVVSMYHFMNGWFVEPGAIPIAEFASAWMHRVDGGTDIWRHLLSWWAQRDNPNVLLLTYEGMTKRPDTTIRRIAEFIGVDLDDDLLALTIRQSSLAFMLDHKAKFADPMMRKATVTRCGFPMDSDSAKVRQGRPGSGTRELPSEVAAELDRLWATLVTPVTGAVDYESLVSTLDGP
jgi:hypothetical protein